MVWKHRERKKQLLERLGQDFTEEIKPEQVEREKGHVLYILGDDKSFSTFLNTINTIQILKEKSVPKSTKQITPLAVIKAPIICFLCLIKI